MQGEAAFPIGQFQYIAFPPPYIRSQYCVFDLIFYNFFEYQIFNNMIEYFSLYFFKNISPIGQFQYFAFPPPYIRSQYCIFDLIFNNIFEYQIFNNIIEYLSLYFFLNISPIGQFQYFAFPPAYIQSEYCVFFLFFNNIFEYHICVFEVISPSFYFNIAFKHLHYTQLNIAFLIFFSFHNKISLYIFTFQLELLRNQNCKKLMQKEGNIALSYHFRNLYTSHHSLGLFCNIQSIRVSPAVTACMRGFSCFSFPFLALQAHTYVRCIF